MHMHHHGGPHRGWPGCCGGGGRHEGRRTAFRTGNAAFDEYFAAKMAEFETELAAFREFRAEQRRKRDAEAFEAFKAARKDEPKASAE